MLAPLCQISVKRGNFEKNVLSKQNHPRNFVADKSEGPSNHGNRRDHMAHRKLPDDRTLVELYLARDESAIDGTAKKYGTALTALSARITECTEDAEECVNDTYLDA